MKTERSRLAASLLVATGLVLLTGCYERTVRAEGFGAKWQTGKVYSPNLKAPTQGEMLKSSGGTLLGPRTIEERER